MAKKHGQTPHNPSDGEGSKQKLDTHGIAKKAGAMLGIAALTTTGAFAGKKLIDSFPAKTTAVAEAPKQTAGFSEVQQAYLKKSLSTLSQYANKQLVNQQEGKLDSRFRNFRFSRDPAGNVRMQYVGDPNALRPGEITNIDFLGEGDSTILSTVRKLRPEEIYVMGREGAQQRSSHPLKEMFPGYMLPAPAFQGSYSVYRVREQVGQLFASQQGLAPGLAVVGSTYENFYEAQNTLLTTSGYFGATQMMPRLTQELVGRVADQK